MALLPVGPRTQTTAALMENWQGIERFELLAKIGEGTFGVVYKAKVLDGPNKSKGFKLGILTQQTPW